jgi:hypothetical protein
MEEPKKLGPPGPRVAEVGSETQLVLGLLSYESFLARYPLLLLHPSLVISCAPSLSSTDMYYIQGGGIGGVVLL